jgi:type IV secretory pathway VirD2 relaxase
MKGVGRDFRLEEEGVSSFAFYFVDSASLDGKACFREHTERERERGRERDGSNVTRHSQDSPSLRFHIHSNNTITTRSTHHSIQATFLERNLQYSLFPLFPM